MPDQRDVQQLIQSLTPSAVNNGNPNTVYNQPQPQGGYIPPTYDAGTNTWRINPAPAPSTVNWQQMSASQPQSWGWQGPTQPTPPPVVAPPVTTPTGPTTPVPPPFTGGTGTAPPIGLPSNLPQSPAVTPDYYTQDDSMNGCVVVDSFLSDYDRADEVEVGDEMFVIDPVSYRKSVGKVSYSETKLMPCVRIMTESGITLDCSRTAPIADEHGNQILAPDLLNKLVPVCDKGVFYLDRVASIEDLGELEVRHITVEDNFFLAGKEKGKYLFHHNMKMGPGSAMNLNALYEGRENQFGWSNNTGGFGAESMGSTPNTRGAMQANGTWDTAHGGTASNPATAWGQAQQAPVGQGIVDAYGNPVAGAADNSGYMSEEWEGLGNPNIDTWDTSWMQPAPGADGGNGMYDWKSTASEANDTGGFWDKVVNWADNNIAGNMYDETTNSWNKGNIGWGVLTSITGLPFDDVAQRVSINSMMKGEGAGADYARTQTQQVYDRSNPAQREAMVTSLAEQYKKTPQEVLQIIGRMR